MKKLQQETIFVGRPFADQLMDEQRTFSKSNLEIERDPVFQRFLADNQLSARRSSMLVFGQENFMYWYGVLAARVVEVPQGLLRFVLPAAQVAFKESTQQERSFFNLPVNLILPQFLEEVTASGIAVYENPGDSATPYYVQDLDLETKKLTQMLYL
ncbi:hypothetical protein EQ500_06025, partial [Lactobacillus sp. XV13L]|nr:hypothetical protein [Lactobacillus sp. XV13L]